MAGKSEETRSKEIFGYLKKAKKFIDDQKSKDAIPELEAALEISETNKIRVLILETLTDCTIDIKDNDSTMKYLEELCELDLTYHNAEKLIQVYMYHLELNKSVALAEKLRALEVKNDDDRYELVKLMFKAGAVDKALEEFATWEKTNPDNTEAKMFAFKNALNNGGNRNAYDFHVYGHILYRISKELIAAGLEQEIYKELSYLYRRLYDPIKSMDYLRKFYSLQDKDKNYSEYYNAISDMYMFSHYTGLLEDDEYIKFMREIYEMCKPQDENTDFKVNTNYLKKIRVGFVSSDFAMHSVGKFITSLFRSRITNTEIETYCYYTLNTVDSITEAIEEASDVFKHCGHLHDEQLGEELLKDNLDIVIDLNNRSYGTKLSLLAHRFAPIQMTWMGFPFTCAMPRIDYAIGDPFLDPPDNRTEKFMTEKIARMKPSYMCYALDLNMNGIHAAEEPPCVKNGYITFGNMNNPTKFSPHTLKLWKEVLDAVPGSKLYIKVPKMDGFLKDIFKKMMEENGLEWDRLIVTPPTDPFTYMNCYNDIDIMLDTTPFSGCTTLAESFFMGMPTITLKGEYRQARHFVLLEQVGLGDLAADTDRDYVDKAVSLANDVERIRKIKHELPDSIKASPLFDTYSFRLSFENMIRQVYVRHCFKNKKPFDTSPYEEDSALLLSDCMRAHEVLDYLISDGEDGGIVSAVIKEYYEMATLLLPMILGKGNLPEDAERTVSLSLSVLTLINGFQDASTAVKLIESNNKLLFSLWG